MQQPTVPELVILKILWDHDSLSAKSIHEAAVIHLAWSYSSTRKTLDRMIEKGLVDSVSKESKKSYRAKVVKVTVLAGYVQDLAKRVFELDGPLPVAMFSDSHLIDENEIDDLEKILNELSEGEG